MCVLGVHSHTLWEEMHYAHFQSPCVSILINNLVVIILNISFQWVGSRGRAYSCYYVFGGAEGKGLEEMRLGRLRQRKQPLRTVIFQRLLPFI